MISAVRRMLAAGLAVTVLAAAAAAGAVEVAKARPTAGRSTVTREGKTTDVGGATQFQEGDVLRVPDSSRLLVEFADGASLALVGPATLRFGPMDAKGRRVVLAAGAISEATVRGIAMEIQAPAPYDVSFVLQNARGFARVNPGDRIVFQKMEGAFAKVWRDGKWTDVGDTAWSLNVRDGTVGPAPAAAGQPRAATTKPVALADGSKMVVVRGTSIRYYLGEHFTEEWMEGGGLRLTFQGPEDEFGAVTVGQETTLYLARGQSVEFDGAGDVVRFDGVTHLYQPVFDTIFETDPIETPIDASPSRSGSR